jgi:hypothetical protein
LLRFVVESALDGRVEHLKERTLGVVVFHRPPDYDTNLDPVVRMTAVEIRKRIAQYYQEPGHESELRICFPPGSYRPEFRMPPEIPVIEPAPAPTAVRKYGSLRVTTLAGGVIAAMLLVGVFWAKPGLSPNSAIERFWAPVWNSPTPVLLLIGRAMRAPEDQGGPLPPPPTSISDLMREEGVAFADATTLARFTGLMMTKGKPFHIRRFMSVKFDDLRDGPVILIGGFNNDWTLRLSGQLRFQFERARPISWIADQENPGVRRWFIDTSAPYTQVQDDYAVISRVLDPSTGRLVVTAAGLTKYGTAAAGEFLTDPQYLRDITAKAPRDWDRKNIQIVISTRLMGETSGPPKVIATHFVLIRPYNRRHHWAIPFHFYQMER